MKCPKCRATLPLDSTFCPKCGERLPSEQGISDESPNRESKRAGSSRARGDQRPTEASQFLDKSSPGRSDAPTRGRARDNAESEEPIWRGGYSWKAMIGIWLGAALLSAVVLLGAGSLVAERQDAKSALGLAAIVVVVLWGGSGLWYLYRRLNVAYALTSQRLTYKSGILIRTTDQIELIDIDDVTYRQGLIERLLGVGTILVSSSDRTSPELYLIGIDGVQQVAGWLDDARREQRRRHAVQVESI